jgi:hypothetical protein
MRKAVVDNPEQAFGGTIPFHRQLLAHQSAKRFDAGRRFTLSHHVLPAHVPSGQILQCSTLLVLVFQVAGPARRQSRMVANARLDTGVLVSTE